MKNLSLYLGLAGVLVAAAAGCNKKSRTPTAQTAPPAAPVATVNLETAGSISGIVRLDGTPPVFRPINMSAEPYCAKAHPKPLMPQQVVAGPDGALANVVVYVKGGDLQKYSFPTPAQPVLLDQRGCMYVPHIVALMTNQPLEVRNLDKTTHNVHALPVDNPEWNESQPIGAPPIKQRFAVPENAIPLQCNVHPWMKAYVFVFANPYFAVTAKDGKFEINNLPPGTYTVEAWQEKYGVEDQSVTLGPRQSKEVSFTFKTGTAAE